jgi:hypothetical protein
LVYEITQYPSRVRVLGRKKFKQWSTILNVKILGEKYNHAMKPHNKMINVSWGRKHSSNELHNTKC